MSDRGGARMDFLAWGLLLTGLIVALCVFSYDPPTGGVYPSPPWTNLFGPPGAWLAQELYETLGVAVYALLASWFVLVLLLLREDRWAWSFRLAGWLLLLPCATVIADVVGPDFLGGPLVGSGGALGSLLNAWLEQQFGPLGGFLLFAGCFGLGLMLALDFILLAGLRLNQRLGRFTWGFLRGLGRVFAFSFGWLPFLKSRQPIQIRHFGEAMEVDEEDLELGQSDAIPIRHANGSAEEEGHEPRILPINRPKAIPDQERFANFELPPLTLLEDPEPFPYEEHDQRLR